MPHGVLGEAIKLSTEQVALLLIAVLVAMAIVSFLITVVAVTVGAALGRLVAQRLGEPSERRGRIRSLLGVGYIATIVSFIVAWQLSEALALDNQSGEVVVAASSVLPLAWGIYYGATRTFAPPPPPPPGMHPPLPGIPGPPPPDSSPGSPPVGWGA